jgi:hypothetical protein
MNRSPSPLGRLTTFVIGLAIVELTLTTAYIHLNLGGLLFTLNAAGYAGLALAVGVTALQPAGFIGRFAWLPRLGLAGYTAATIVGYLVMGPYFALGWIAKAIEVAILTLLAGWALAEWRARPDSNRRSPA